MMENGFCRAPENYKKSLKCKEEVSFDDMNADQKHSYSLACNVDFPFKENEQHENEIKDIRKYQAEIINSMNENTIYKKFDTNEFEKMKQVKRNKQICT
ncbi:hypothetical protein PFMALIP_04506 [Plasmodium falciparum MaliPS096_E11]|uniref:CPW-WPC domain-containing protein n=1 Tax=Plasmodium falciparum MaliPS096_E11 TaxID=1036727 RepID=A0A024WJV4_PLAFA|nr:hypothetical protein PFMALIP_04506 [Plasmodium falciparum MaliPS096_E11]